jgi:hypothetical protein
MSLVLGQNKIQVPQTVRLQLGDPLRRFKSVLIRGTVAHPLQPLVPHAHHFQLVEDAEEHGDHGARQPGEPL